MTGLAVWSLIHGLVPPSDPAVSAGIEFILGQQVTDETRDDYGAIHTGQPVYETAIAILALRATNNPAYIEEMTLAADYLAMAQNDEGVDFPHVGTIDETHWAYGGWSYSRASEEPYPSWEEPEWYEARAEVWRKAEDYFVTNCQNPDGGFGYKPGDGSNERMTAAGVWCLRLAGVPVEEERVEDGLASLECSPALAADSNYYYLYLWSAAKAFTMCDLPPMLEEGNWYSDFAGYLVANQEEDGRWLNPLFEEGQGETHLNATEYALLVLERAVLPPPPGIDKIQIEINSMKILFDRSPNRDNIEIKGDLQLAEDASYNLDEDRVKVTIDGVVNVIILAGSFAGSAGKYEFKLDSEPKVGMKLNFHDGTWSLKVEHIDASIVDNKDGVDVTLVIGDMFAGKNVVMFCNDLVYP
ncbi:hypothetical protein ACFLW6_02945 [Chloroflexota bacterium]